MNRGDVVLVDFTRVAGPTAKRRPAVVVQNDNDNRRMTNTIVAMITGNVSRSGEPTQLPIDPATADGAGRDSARIGRQLLEPLHHQAAGCRPYARPFGPALLVQIDKCLKVALGTD